MIMGSVRALFPAELRGREEGYDYIPAAVSRARMAPSNRWIQPE
jgi:hypothetical protein